MAKTKASNSISTHDRKVRQVVRKLEEQGYAVRANVRGRERPGPIGSKKLVPDIEALRHGLRIIVEVETPESLMTDKEQLKTFARHARQKKETRFDIVVTKPRRQ